MLCAALQWNTQILFTAIGCDAAVHCYKIQGIVVFEAVCGRWSFGQMTPPWTKRAAAKFIPFPTKFPLKVVTAFLDTLQQL